MGGNFMTEKHQISKLEDMITCLAKIVEDQKQTIEDLKTILDRYKTVLDLALTKNKGNKQ